jgi:predicted nuclease of restriction endonuclease-like (RecB) superfamily
MAKFIRLIRGICLGGGLEKAHKIMSDISTFHHDIRIILETARKKARSAINYMMVEAYWLIGQRIVEEEQNGNPKSKYGEKLLENLSIALGNTYGKGFSYSNLRNFRQFYLTYPDQEICYTLCSKLTWSHNRLIMRIEDQEARQYYLQEASTENWTVRQLERNIKSQSYQRLLSTQVQPQKQSPRNETLDFIKDPYVLEFLQLPETNKTKESTLEQAIIDKLQTFLLEMGKGFSFVARQMRISTETSHFYLDLVFYNYLLKCFVIIDLKTGKLTHQDIGQMDMYMYVRMFDDLKRGEDDNPTIGIILCENKDETIVKYSVLKENEQLFASKYQRILPSEEELIAEIEREKHLIKTESHYE